jgi:hypothetical protein
MRKISLFLISILLLAVLPGGAQGAQTPDEQWFAPADKTRGGLVGFDYSEGFEFQRLTTQMTPNFPAGMQIFNSDGTSNLPKICAGVKDPGCSKAISFGYHAVFPACDEIRKLDCIENIWAEIDGKKIFGIYKENIPAKPTTPYGDEGAANLIVGSTPSVWQIPGLLHGGGKDTYVVNSLISQASDSAGSPVQFNTGGTFRAGISPVNLISGNYPSLIAGQSFPTGDEYRVCATFGDNRCALKQAFPSNVRFGISIKMSQPPIGWLHGRFKAPAASIEKIQGGARINISADPIQVPTVAGNFPLSDYPAEVQKSHQEDNGRILMMRRGGTAETYGVNPGVTGGNNFIYQPSLSGTTSSLRLVLPLTKDKSSAEPTTWKISTLSYFENNEAAFCVTSSNKLAGIVSTNSTTYSDGPPKLDPKTQSLDYELASAHYTSKGEEFLGTYDLVLDAQVARCIYGFKKTPTSATISIVKDGNIEKVSTSVLTEKDGWLSLSAYGFTFSSPKISVKLIEPASVPVVAPSIKPTPTKVATQKSIVCAQGKSKKKLTGTNPKCPKGYKLVK